MNQPNPGPAQPEVTPEVAAETQSRAAFGLAPKPASGNPANDAPKADEPKPDGNLAKPADEKKQPDSPDPAKADVPKKFLGKYETPEAAEVAFKQTQSSFTKLQLEHEKTAKELAEIKAQLAAVTKPAAPEKPVKGKTEARNSPEFKAALDKVEELGGKELADAILLLSSGQKDTVEDSRIATLEERFANYEASVRQKELESELIRIRPEFADPEVQKDVRALAKKLHEAADNQLLFLEILLDANIGQKFPERFDKAVNRKLQELTAKEKEKLMASNLVGDGTPSAGTKSKYTEAQQAGRAAFGLPV